MENYKIENVVCDYGIYEKGKLKLILNDKQNAKLILEILRMDDEHKRHPKANVLGADKLGGKK